MRQQNGFTVRPTKNYGNLRWPPLHDIQRECGATRNAATPADMEADRGRACSASTVWAGPLPDGPPTFDREVENVNEVSTGSQRPPKRTAFQTAMWLRRIGREHADAMYGWHHPHNLAWAAARAAARRTAYAGVQCFSMGENQ